MPLLYLQARSLAWFKSMSHAEFAYWKHALTQMCAKAVSGKLHLHTLQQSAMKALMLVQNGRSAVWIMVGLLLGLRP